MSESGDEIKQDAVVVQQNDKIEKLRKERTNLRRLFTTTCTQFEEKYKEKEKGKDLGVIFNKLADKAERLFKTDELISELVDQSDKDFDQMETYRDRFIELKTEYEHYLLLSSNNATPTDTAPIGKLKLPKIELKEYDLMPRTWVAFWAQFSRIHEDATIREEDKFQYLLSSLKPYTKARSIVESYPPSKKNYGKVIEHLESRFGRRDLLIDVFIRDLLTLVNNRANTKLSDLYDKLGSSLRALETLGVTTQNYAAMLYPVVESCLPTDVLKAWDRYSLNRDVGDEETVQLTKEKLLENLMAFLRREVEGEEHRALAEKAFGQSSRNKKESSSKDEPTAMALASSHEKSFSNSECIFCQKQHPSQDCWKARAMKLTERKNHVKQKRCCLVCLKRGHMARSCHSSVRCLVCGQRHYALLCPDLHSSNAKLPPKETNGTTEAQEVNNATLFTSQPVEHLIHLKTVMIRLRHNGKEKIVRTLIDDGSHRSYIEKGLAQELDLVKVGKEEFAQGLFGGVVTPIREHGSYCVTAESLDRHFSKVLTLLDQDKICTTLPRIKDKKTLKELKDHNIVLTDIGCDTPPVQMLLGADVVGSILTGKIQVLPSGLSAVETQFGWTVLGLVGRRKAVKTVALNLKCFKLQSMWDLETLGITDPIEQKPKTVLDEETVLHFKETLSITDEHRYEVALPWLAGHPPLPNNFEIAERRLQATTKRLLKENNFDLYNEVFLQWERDKIIEKVKPHDNSRKVHYLPHRPVIKMSSETTKIRPVYDASVKTHGYSSLNDCLSTGPSFTEKISPLLNRFRFGAIGVTADIKQAFLQIVVRPVDRDVLHFLWWQDKDHKVLQEFRHCRVVFGLTSSPFLLSATILHHLKLEEFQTEEFQLTIKKLQDGFYVDNLVTSVDNITEFEMLRNQAKEIMSLGKFDLRCWAYTGDQERTHQKVLGLKWDITTDTIQCALSKTVMNQKKCNTKRTVLSVLNSIYDPIGFTCPAMLLPKLILQEAWRRKVNWDESLPQDLNEQFEQWLENIHLIENYSIPRRIFYGELSKASLHVFSDGSEKAYACCAFLRSAVDSEIHVRFVAAKTRVAPMEKCTIPRMELLGAMIAARLARSILDALKISVKTYFWTDSMVVLAWIQRKEPWNTFVGNRVKEIRLLSDSNCWRHVPGSMNPADLPSRGCSWLDLHQSNWCDGPQWLRESEASWPNEILTCPEESLLEKKKLVVASSNMCVEESFSRNLLYFSEYAKLIRMVGWIWRFYENSRKKKTERCKSPILNTEEVQHAENSLIELIQREWPTEQRQKYEKSMKFCSEDNLLKVQTRLIFSNDDDCFKFPIVLPDNPIIRRLVMHVHRLLCHAGVLTVLTYLRERYWIPRGRKIIREVISKCMQCKRHSVKPTTTDSPPLPIDRVARVGVFQVIGVDLAGPLLLRGGAKAWIVLITCSVYRALHLELITSLSTDVFIQALRRFVARRGRPITVYSDNGTNFVGTSNALKSIDWSQVVKDDQLSPIRWKFIPPSAAWWGGWWERLVRLVKDLLKRSLGKANLKYEEMITVLCDCEAAINKRPITYLSEDPNEPQPLTPAHFILQTPSSGDLIDLDTIDRNHLIKRVRYLQEVRENFRKRFKREYLSELVRYPEIKRRRNLIKVGDIVLVGSDNTKRISWPLARVLELYTGRDGQQRVAKIKTGGSEIIRPLQRLYPLEIDLTELSSFNDNRVSSAIPERSLDTGTVQSPTRVSSFEDKGKEEKAEDKAETFTRRGRRVKKLQRLDL